jgi:para-aminobenzoate synthetase/4-amino-4-deoxychorismate lyase
MTRSAAALGFGFDRHQARNELQAASFGAGNAKVRLLLARGGAIAVEVCPLPDGPQGPVDVAIAPLPVSPLDFRLRHKTSNRSFYREARRASGAFELIFADPAGFLTEGSFPGILRERLLEEGRAEEADLRVEDLASGFLIGNAVRGLIPGRLV